MTAKPSGVTHGRRRNVFRWLRKGRLAIVLLAALCMGLLASATWFRQLPAPERWETQVYDIRFRSRGSEAPNPQVAITGIGPTSLNQSVLEPLIGDSEAVALMHGHNWPWPRTVHAKVIERLFELGARAVAVDIVFAGERAEDDLLAPVLEKYKDRIVLASIVQESEGRLTFLQPNSRLQRALAPHSAVGYASVVKDQRDGIVRRFDFRTSELREFGFNEDDTQDLLSFAALAVTKVKGGEVPRGYGQFLNYQGIPRTYPHVPVEEIFTKNFSQGSRYDDGKVFQDKLVFYGPIAEVLHDVHSTPFGVMPGVEIHAQLAGSLMSDKLLSWAGGPATRAVAIIAALLGAAAILFIRNPLWQAISIIGVGAIYWFASQATFSYGRLLLPTIPPFIALAGTGAFGIVFLFFLEQWEKTQTRKVLERSVNKRIAKVMLHNEEFDQARRGERRPVTILFSDIRNFTTWSESAAPEHLVGQLNEYFERMVELVERDGSLGNAQKFIGDAILAAWGDTPENRFGDAEDARRAVSVAVEMRAALKELNAGWADRGERIPLSIGIGINLGDVVVGEVGHPERREYTVLGDGVNFAARLESATKQYRTDCLVGERVEELTRQHFRFRHVDYLRVKGKTKPVNVYILVGDRNAPGPEWLDDYHRARALYVERKFTEAAALFRAVQTTIGEEDFLCQSYATRCDAYAQFPPPRDWDGSYTMTDK